MKIIKVLVVDDSAYNRDVLSKMLDSSPYVDVVGTAADGEEAIERVVRLKPDLITLDLEMPRMDGFTFLRWLMKSMPLPVLVVSSRADDKSVIRALEFGAVDFLPKPVGPGMSMEDLRAELLTKVKTFAPVEMKRVSSSVALLEQVAREKPAAGMPPPRMGADKAAACGRYEMLAIGASTGGPPAIQAILTKLPKDFPAAVAVSQHMPANFTRFFAERLDKLSALEVKEAQHGDLVFPGRALICPGGSHMAFERAHGSVRVVLRDIKPSDKYAPSIDVMMTSAAHCYGGKTAGVILTGMGNDGAEGVVSIKGAGGVTFAESKETAVIYGMPKEAVKSGAVDHVLPLGMMADELIKTCC
ncbi:MAG: chemotaxis response regulator protein-glutamate methylesterase [Nitrospirae bacterium]|nr:chemotaxis response regulator protein-glutamate methylesterase [Nitrospirota bacterium]